MNGSEDQWEFAYRPAAYAEEMERTDPVFDPHVFINWCVKVVGHPLAAIVAPQCSVPPLEVIKGNRGFGRRAQQMHAAVAEFEVGYKERFGSPTSSEPVLLFETKSEQFEVDGVVVQWNGVHVKIDSSVMTFETAAKIAARVLSSTFAEGYDRRYFVHFLVTDQSSQLQTRKEARPMPTVATARQNGLPPTPVVSSAERKEPDLSLILSHLVDLQEA